MNSSQALTRGQPSRRTVPTKHSPVASIFLRTKAAMVGAAVSNSAKVLIGGPYERHP